MCFTDTDKSFDTITGKRRIPSSANTSSKKDGAFDLSTQIIAYASRLCTGTPISGFDKVFIILVGYLNT